MTPDPVDRSAAFPDGRINDGWSAFLKFVTGYVVEESLSVDNVFVIAMLFQYFAVPRRVSASRAVLGHPRRGRDARR